MLDQVFPLVPETAGRSAEELRRIIDHLLDLARDLPDPHLTEEARRRLGPHLQEDALVAVLLARALQQHPDLFTGLPPFSALSPEAAATDLMERVRRFTTWRWLRDLFYLLGDRAHDLYLIERASLQRHAAELVRALCADGERPLATEHDRRRHHVLRSAAAVCRSLFSRRTSR